MRYLSTIVAPLGISATLLVGQAVAQVEPPAPPECPIKTAVENTVIARAWHDDVINRRNPAILQDILASDVVHHAAGGYPKVMDATGIAAMMAEFLTAFPDLRYTFDQFIVQDDYVVERYTAVGTQQGQFGDLPASGAWQPGLESISSHQVRTNRGGLVGGRCRGSKAAAHGRYLG
jgi:predicted ester cyclase